MQTTKNDRTRSPSLKLLNLDPTPPKTHSLQQTPKAKDSPRGWACRCGLRHRHQPQPPRRTSPNTWGAGELGLGWEGIHVRVGKYIHKMHLPVCSWHIVVAMFGAMPNEFSDRVPMLASRTPSNNALTLRLLCSWHIAPPMFPAYPGEWPTTSIFKKLYTQRSFFTKQYSVCSSLFELCANFKSGFLEVQ